MKKTSIIFLLLLASLIIKADNCSLAAGDSSTDSTSHKTQIQVLLSGANGGTDKVAVTIDGKSVGTIEGRQVLAVGVTEGDHTISAVSLIKSSEKWPEATLAVLAGQTFSFALRIDPVHLTIASSIDCKNKGIDAIRVSCQMADGNPTSEPFNLGTGQSTTIDVANGATRVLAQVYNTANASLGAVLFDGSIPWQASGANYTQFVECN